MKVKAVPSDFIVKEESTVRLQRERAAFAVFHLSKRSWDTFDLIDLIARRWNVRRADISVGGMKDRHGSTEQLISVRGLAGQPIPLQEANFSLRFEGWSDAPVTAREVRGNRFAITLRNLSPREAELLGHNVQNAARCGIPNYYDEQRFGSARHGAGFMGKEMFLGRREQALRLYFTPSKHDDQKTRKLKKCVVENWGRWAACAGMGFGGYGRILAYLAGHTRAYHHALELIDRRFLVFVLNAYQSFLFNEILGKWLSRVAGESGVALASLKYAFGQYLFYAHAPEGMIARLSAASLPVPGHDTACADPQIREVLDEVLAGEGIGLRDLRVRQMHGISVGGVERAAVVFPEDLELDGEGEDDMYPGTRKATLRFFLPRGSYATLLIKRLTLAPAR